MVSEQQKTMFGASLSYNTTEKQFGVDSLHNEDTTSNCNYLSFHRHRQHHHDDDDDDYDDSNGTNMNSFGPSTRKHSRRRGRSSSSSCCCNSTATATAATSSSYSFGMLSTIMLMVLVLSSLSPSSVVVSAEYCNICPNAPGSVRSLTPIRDGSNLPNPTGIVQNYLTEGTTCTDLQVSVGDVISSIVGGGNDLEVAHCTKTQFLACLSGCCHNDNGQGLTEPLGSGVCYTQNVHDPNPACDLCGGPTQRQFHYVPEPNIEKLTDTKYVGTHNCRGLYQAAAEGIFSSNFCPLIQQESGEDCCNL